MSNIQILPSFNKCKVNNCRYFKKKNEFCLKHYNFIVNELKKQKTVKSNTTKLCKTLNCTSRTQSKGLCARHGGKKICKIPECIKYVQSKGVCAKHGGTKKCKIDNCNNVQLLDNRCYTHNREKYIKLNTCKVHQCRSLKRRNGLCYKHLKTINKIDITYILN